MQIAIKTVAAFCLAISLFSWAPQAVAQTSDSNSNASGLWTRQFGITDIGRTVFGETGDFNSRDRVIYIALSVIKIALSFVGLVFLALILVAGFKWMTAGGKDDQIKQATKNITNAVIGLIIILAAWGLTTFALIRIKLIAQGDPNFNNPDYYEFNQNR